MDVKSAVRNALEYVNDLFAAENISNLGLEEVEFDEKENIWIVTVGFSRPWDYSTKNALTALANPSGQPKRSYKVVRIHDDNPSHTPEVISIKSHEVSA
jgi:hypothetical protein